MPTCEPKFQPKVASVGVVDLFAPEMASPFTTSTGVTLPVSTPLVSMVSILGALPKPCAPILVKLAATVSTPTGGFPPTRIRLALAAPASEHEKLAVKSNVFNFIGMLPFALASLQPEVERRRDPTAPVKAYFLDATFFVYPGGLLV